LKIFYVILMILSAFVLYTKYQKTKTLGFKALAVTALSFIGYLYGSSYLPFICIILVLIAPKLLEMLGVTESKPDTSIPLNKLMFNTVRDLNAIATEDPTIQNVLLDIERSKVAIADYLQDQQNTRLMYNVKKYPTEWHEDTLLEVKNTLRDYNKRVVGELTQLQNFDYENCYLALSLNVGTVKPTVTPEMKQQCIANAVDTRNNLKQLQVEKTTEVNEVLQRMSNSVESLVQYVEGKLPKESGVNVTVEKFPKEVTQEIAQQIAEAYKPMCEQILRELVSEQQRAKVDTNTQYVAVQVASTQEIAPINPPTLETSTVQEKTQVVVQETLTAPVVEPQTPVVEEHPTTTLLVTGMFGGEVLERMRTLARNQIAEVMLYSDKIPAAALEEMVHTMTTIVNCIESKMLRFSTKWVGEDFDIYTNKGWSEELNNCIKLDIPKGYLVTVSIQE